MKSNMFRLGLASALLIGGAVVPAAAQQSRGLEFGMDAGLFHYSYSSGNGPRPASTTVLSFPVSSVRAAFPLSGSFELEPAATLVYQNGGGRTAVTFSGNVGLLMELGGDSKLSQWYVRPSVGLILASSSGFSTSDRATIGAGVGTRMRLTDRIAARYEARYQYVSKANNYSMNVVGLLAGLSIFTR